MILLDRCESNRIHIITHMIIIDVKSKNLSGILEKNIDKITYLKLHTLDWNCIEKLCTIAKRSIYKRTTDLEFSPMR